MLPEPTPRPTSRLPVPSPSRLPRLAAKPSTSSLRAVHSNVSSPARTSGSLPMPSKTIENIKASPLPPRKITNPVPHSRSGRHDMSASVGRSAGALTLASNSSPRPSIRGTEPQRPSASSSSASSSLRVPVVRRAASMASMSASARSSSPRTPVKSQTFNQGSDRATVTTPASPKTPIRVSMREQIAAKRKALMSSSSTGDSLKESPIEESFGDLSVSTNTDNTDDRSGGDPFGRSLGTLMTKAIRTGKLNIPSMGLDRLPREVWTKMLRLDPNELEEPLGDRLSPSEMSSIHDAGEEDLPPHVLAQRAKEREVEDVPFYDVVDLAVLRAPGNLFKSIDKHIGGFGALKILDLRSNLLRDLPETIIDLRELVTLDVSHNELSGLPKSVILLPSLTTLNLSHNSLTSFTFDSPTRPSQAVLDYHNDNSFLTSFPGTPTRSKYIAVDTDRVMPSLKTLDLQGNRITNQGLPKEWPEMLESIDLSGNILMGQLLVDGLAGLKHLKSLKFVKNGLRGIVTSGSLRGKIWQSLELVDLSLNDLESEDIVKAALGDSSRMKLMLAGNPALESLAFASIKPSRKAPVEISTADEQEVPSLVVDAGAEPLRACFNSQRAEMIIGKELGKSLLDETRQFDLELVTRALPAGSSLKTLSLNGIIPLKAVIFPSGRSVLSQVTSLNIVDTSLETTSTLFKAIAQSFPVLEELDLSGSFLTSLDGVEQLIAQGLKKLYVRGGRIENFDAIEKVAESVRHGTWQGKMLLEELDVRDNSVPRLIESIGCLPLRVLLVDNNAFRIPNRKHWERGTPALLQWLRDGL